MNAIEEVERLETIRALTGDKFPVLPYKAMMKMKHNRLLHLHQIVGDYYVSTSFKDEEQTNMIREYWYDICDVCESRHGEDFKTQIKERMIFF